ncbi:MAG: FAD-dependent oxidoreductase, partial [Bacillati bacterium ANGP1]
MTRSGTGAGMGGRRTVQTVREPAQDVPVVADADVVVIGGGPAGFAAAVAAARAGARTLLVERYGYLGGMASGGMVLLLADMSGHTKRTVAGICYEFLERLIRLGGAVAPPEEECFSRDPEFWWRWARWGFEDFYAGSKPLPTTYAAAFDPEAWKYAAFEVCKEAGVTLRLHSWFSRALVENGRVRVYASAGAPFVHGRYLMSLVHRMAQVDVDRIIAFDRAHPEESRKLNAEVKRLVGGSWDFWWLRTVREGVVWCNCPHLHGLDALSVEDLTRVEIESRERLMRVIAWLRGRMPGFERAYVLDAAPQAGVRQARVLRGEYVMTMADVLEGRRFPDVIGRGRDYFMPYRALLPRGVDGLLVAG